MDDAGVMKMTAHEGELRFFNDSLRRDTAVLAEGLRAILGATFVAHIGGVRETRAVRGRVDSTRNRPRSWLNASAWPIVPRLFWSAERAGGSAGLDSGPEPSTG